jgi:hypothetical protein
MSPRTTRASRTSTAPSPWADELAEAAEATRAQLVGPSFSSRPTDTRPPLEKVFEKLEARGFEVETEGAEYKARCPGHKDANPSWVFREDENGNVLSCCRSHGCSIESVAAGLGLRVRDFFSTEKKTPAQKKAAKATSAKAQAARDSAAAQAANEAARIWERAKPCK